MAVRESVNVPLDVGLGVWTEALRLQMGLELEGPGALGMGRRDAGRLHGGLRVRLCRRDGGLLNTWRVGDADGRGGLGVWYSNVRRTELICEVMQGVSCRRR